MKRFILIACSLLVGTKSFSQASEYYLPSVTDGRWYILKKNVKVKLPEKYDYVNCFDAKGFAFFSVGANFGVLDTTGEEVLSAKHKEMVQYGNGMFRYTTEKGYLLISLVNKTSIPCNWSEQFTENWIRFKQEGNEYVMHTSWKTPLNLLDTKSLLFVRCNYVYIKNFDQSYTLYDQDGTLVETNPEIINHSENSLYVKGKKVHFFVNENGKYNLPLAAKNVRYTNKTVSYLFKESVWMVDIATKQVKFSVKGEDLVFAKTFYYLYKENKVGMVSLDGKLVFPAEYSFFRQSQGNFIVCKDGSTGIVNANGKLVVPCIYQSILPSGAFYRTTFFNGENGLLSSLTFREIIPPYFNKITVSGMTVRAWDRKGLVIVELDELHNEVNRIFLDNVVSMNVYNDVSKNRRLDARLLNIGWFYTTKFTENAKDKTRSSYYLWGIKKEDSIVVSARYRTPVYVENAGFSLLASKKIKDAFTSNLFGEVRVNENTYVYEAFNVEKHRVFSKFSVLQLDTMDFLTKEFARIQTEHSLGYITKSGIANECMYIDDEYDGMTRFCHGGKAEFWKGNNEIHVTFPTFISTDNFSSINTSHLTIHQAKWNFLSNNGDSIFKTPFLYACNFQKGTALVKGEKGWGVVSKDSVVIPTVFTNVKRVSQASDTLFLVSRIKDRVLFLDTNLKVLPFSITKIEQKSDSLLVIRSGDDYHLVNHEYKVLETSKRKYYLINKHYVVNKIGKTYVIRTSNLKEIGTSIYQPIQFINEALFTVEKNNRFAIFNLNGDTVKGFLFKSIHVEGKFVYTLSLENKLEVFNNQLKAILHKKHVTLMDVKIDTIKDLVGVQLERKVLVFNSNTMQVAKLELEENEFLSSINNGLIFTDKARILNTKGECLNPGFPIRGYAWEDRNYFIFNDIYDRSHILDKNGVELYQDLDLFDLFYHGEDVISFHDQENRKVVMDMRNNQRYLYCDFAVGQFNSGYLLLLIDGKYVYVNRQFLPVFQKEFENALPFSNGFACVYVNNGWTILGKDGFQKSFPHYEDISQVAPSIFNVETHAVYGVYDNKGKVIVKPEYNQIRFLDNAIIQASKMGEIDYFNFQGVKLD